MAFGSRRPSLGLAHYATTLNVGPCSTEGGARSDVQPLRESKLLPSQIDYVTYESTWLSTSEVRYRVRTRYVDGNACSVGARYAPTVGVYAVDSFRVTSKRGIIHPPVQRIFCKLPDSVHQRTRSFSSNS